MGRGMFNVSSCYGALLFLYSCFGGSRSVKNFQFELGNDMVREHLKTISSTSTRYAISGLLSSPKAPHY